MSEGWIGVDLDGTLAEYLGWQRGRTCGFLLRESVPASHKKISMSFFESTLAGVFEYSADNFQLLVKRIGR